MSNVITNIVLTDESTTATESRTRLTGSDNYQTCEKLTNHFMSIAGKNPRRARFTVQTLNGDGVAATGTVTCASVSAADTVTVGNIVFTAVSGTPSGNQFKRGVSDTADGLSLATAINANTTLSQYVSAANATGAVTVTYLTTGVVGNALQLSSSNNTRLAVVAMASGTNDTSTSSSFSCGI